MSDSYFVVSSGEDGISISGPYTVSKLRELLREDRWGAHGFHAKIPEIDRGCFMDREGQEQLLIIRGDIVVPTPKTVVTEWDLP